MALPNSPQNEDSEGTSTPASGSLPFPVVGIGGSAGGLVALQELFKALPESLGMAFVVVQHLDPNHASNLAEILARATKMPVAVVGDEPTVERNHVYVIPPGRDMIMLNGKLHLIPQQRHSGLHGIDHFFRSLAEDVGHFSVGVVLSGGLSDGTVGLEDIKAAGGLTFAQDESAVHESMPKSAVASGCVDYVLSPDGIAAELVRFSAHPYLVEEPDETTDQVPGHARVTEIVRRATGVDFTHYKSSTLHRRIKRRMMLHRLNALTDYEDHLRRDPAELEELYQDILIGVTSFFRNPEAFEALARDVFPKLIAACPPDEPVRLWVVGCSSGEEAYSLAICFTECAEALGSEARFQLFATDVNQRCVEKARAGWYPRTLVHDVSPERLQQFFVEEGGGYRVRKPLRERCVFSRHNALADPPFLRMDFLSCRNLLIYLEPFLQQKIIPLFHYSLRPGGWLWLGSSESAGTVHDLFDVTDVRHKIHTRRAGGRTPAARVKPPFSSLTLHEPVHVRQPTPAALPRDAERLLLAKYAPPGVVVSPALEIVQFQGDTGPYLAPAAGTASLHLLKMLREGLPTAVRDAVQKVEQSGASLRLEDLRVRCNDGFRRVSVEVIPVKAGSAGKTEGGGFIVLFDEKDRQVTMPPPRSWLGRWWRKWLGISDVDSSGFQSEEIAHLKQELATTRETMQSTLEQHEAAIEELQSANEEAQSANEEMHSIYEELENSKSELEATNKELTALSEELASRNAELNKVNEELRDSDNLYRAIGESINYGVWVCEPDGRNVYASESFLKLVGMTQEQCSNLGWGDVLHPDDSEATIAAWLECVRTGQPWDREHRFKGVDGEWHHVLARGMPVKDEKGNVVKWAGINLDVTARKRADDERARLAAIVEYSDDAIISTNLEGVITSWNRGAAHLFGYTVEEIVGRTVLTIIPEDRHSDEREILDHIRRGKPLKHFETIRRRKDGSVFQVSLTASPIIDADGKIVGASKIARDITARKEVEEALRLRSEENEALLDAMPAIVWKCLDPHCDVITGNRAANELTGVTENTNISQTAAAQGKGVYIKQFKEDGTEYAADELPIQRAMATGQPVRDAQLDFCFADGRRVQVMGSAVPLIDAEGKARGAIAAFLDITKLRTAEGALRNNEALFSAIIEQAPGGVYVVDDQFRVRAVNAISRHIFAAAEPVLGREFTEVMSIIWGPELGPELAAIFRHTLTTGERYIAPPFTAERSDISAEQSFEWEVHRLTLPSGKHGVVCYFTDVTQQRQSEDALRRSEEFKRSIIESSPDCVKVLDLDGNLLSLEAGHDLLGIEDATPLIGTSWMDFWLNEDDRLTALAAVTQAAVGGEGKFTGFRRTWHGLDKWWNVVITPILDAKGKPISLLAVCRDVTESRKMENALRASEARKDAILSSALDAIITMDHMGNLVEFNQAAERIFGHARAEVLGKSLADIIIPERLRERHQQGLTRFLETGEGPVLNKQVELPALRADRTEFPAEFAIIAIPGTHPPMFTAFLRDVTDRRRLEDSLVARADQLARADRNKDEFLAMLAHELRNPLAPLRNATELLKAENLSDEERSHAQSIISRQIENMSRMLDDLLDVSRITEGKIEMRKKPVALESIITAALSLVRGTCAAQHQELSVSMPEEPLYLEADATRLEQVFGNLLTNASKYSGEGSHISIRAERVPDAEPPEVTVIVRDDGAGIDPELLPRIFDLFVQASRTLDRSHGGLGIGLTLVQRLVKLHGGSIEAHSQGHGRGAEFIVHLPLLREAPPSPVPPPATTSDTSRRILIVDDNSDSARSLAMLQGRRGHHTCTAFTGPDAITAAIAFKPDVVLLDIGLPGMDGFEVARHIRAMQGMEKTLIIAMSGYGSAEDRATASEAGFDDYFVKPIDLAALRERMRGTER